jgi:hypothetical protein
MRTQPGKLQFLMSQSLHKRQCFVAAILSTEQLVRFPARAFGEFRDA